MMLNGDDGGRNDYGVVDADIHVFQRIVRWSASFLAWTVVSRLTCHAGCLFINREARTQDHGVDRSTCFCVVKFLTPKP